MVVYANSSDIIHIGRVGENKATTVAFDVTNWIKEFGEGTFNLLIEKDGKIYPRETYMPIKEAVRIDTILFNTDGLHRSYYNLKSKPGLSVYFNSKIIENKDSLLHSVINLDFYDIDKRKNAHIIYEGTEYKSPLTYVFNDQELLSAKNQVNRVEIINGVETSVSYLNIGNNYNELEEIPQKESAPIYLCWDILDIDTKESGLGKCMIDYRVNDVVVKSVTYSYVVTNAIGENETTEPEEYSWVELILDKASFIENNITSSYINSTDAEAWAIGKKNGKAVTADDEQYNKHAKYWADQAKASATNSKNSEKASEENMENSRLWAVGYETFEEGEDEEDGGPIEIIDYSVNNSKYFYEQAVQQKELAEGAAADALNYMEDAMAIAFGGEDAATVVQGLLNNAVSQIVVFNKINSSTLK